MRSCFAVLPLAIWIATIKYCGKEIHDLVFAPSFVTTMVLTNILTFTAVICPGIDRFVFRKIFYFDIFLFEISYCAQLLYD